MTSKLEGKHGFSCKSCSEKFKTRAEAQAHVLYNHFKEIVETIKNDDIKTKRGAGN